MHIPHLLLTPGALRAIVEEFVIRDGPDLSAVEQRIEQVLRQLDAGSAALHSEQETAICAASVTFLHCPLAASFALLLVSGNRR